MEFMKELEEVTDDNPFKKLKVITGKDQRDIIKKYEAFEKTVDVVEIKQSTAKMMFVFYMER